MLTELLKTSAIWGLLLLFYFVFLSREKSPGYNRLFLWLSLALGMLIPFIAVPFSVQLPASGSAAAVTMLPALATAATGGLPLTTASAGLAFRLADGLFYTWLAGVAVQLFILLKNAFQLYYLKQYSIRKHHEIADYYVNDHTPVAFSFGKTIFLPAKDYDAESLRLILKHERDHYQYCHWLDNTALALLQLVFWFHPFFYLFKHQLKLAHEYQVDANVRANDTYEYARLLLVQNQQQYRKNLVHTFNYSSLKKRIAMMTKVKKSANWKYALSIPLFTLCFLLMSATSKSDKRVRKGNITTFRGNTFEWKSAQDTIYVTDPVTGKEQQMVHRSEETIVKCNNEPVTSGFNYSSGKVVNPMLYDIENNITLALLQRKDEFPRKIESIQIMNLVLDKSFRVQYYDVQTIEKNTADTGSGFKILTNAYPEVNDLVDEILSDNRLINPKGLQSDKPFYVSQTKADFVPMAFKVKVLSN